MIRRTHTLTLGGLAWRQMRGRWTSFVPTALGLAVALALASAVTLTQSRTEEASLDQTVNSLGSRGLITVRLTGVQQITAFNQFTRDVKTSTQNVNGLVAERSVLLYSGTYVPQTINGVNIEKIDPAFVRDLIPLEIGVLDDLPAHVMLIAGSWPATGRIGETVEVTVPEDAARSAHVKLGDRECMKVVGGNYVVCIHVAGIWRALNTKDAYWGPEQSVPIAAFTDVPTYFSVLNGEGALDGQLQLVSVATATLSPDKNTIRRLGAQASLNGLRRLHGQLGARRADEVVISELEAALNDYINQVSVAAFAVQLVAIQLLLVALYCVWFLAGNLLSQQRQVIAVWRSRGWSWRGVSILLFIELGVAALIAAPIGLIAGWLASEWAARFQYRGQVVPPFHFDLARLGAPIAAVLLVELLLLAAQSVLASRHGVLRARAAASRPPVSWWQRRYVDVVLALLALPLLAQLRVLGSASVRAAGAADSPVNLVLPGIAMAFIAIAAVRLLPLAALGLGRLRRSVAARLAFMQLRRAHGQHVGLAMLLMLAVAVGVFASTYATTAARNAADRAAYFTGSDARATFGGAVTVLPDAIPIKGSAARSSVFRGDARVADEDVPIIAVDPYTFTPAMYTRDDLAGSPLPGLVQQLATKETGGLLLAPTAKTLSIWAHGSATGGSLSAHLTDSDGRPVHADFGSLDFSGWKQFSAPLLADAGTIRPPLRFRDVAISRVTAAGDVAVSALAVDGTVIETFAQMIEGLEDRQFPGFWWRTDSDSGSMADYVQPSAAVPRNGSRTASFRVVPAAIPTYLRPGQVEQALPGFATALTGLIPALVPAQMLSRLGLSLGQTAQIQVGNVAMTVLLIGVADHFPTMYPEEGDFMVLDRDPLLVGLSFGRHQRPWTNEIWVRAASGGADPAAASLKAAPGVVQVYDRRAVETAATRSPAQLELASNLLLGFAAASALALLAFALHFLVIARARLVDYAVLEANGMSPAMVQRSMVVEQSVLLAFSALMGFLLGLLVSFVVLPVLQLSSSAPDNVPQTIVTFNPGALALVLGVVIVGALAAGLAIAASERPEVMSELRSLG
ncbi:MAG: hypothetical protein AUG06_07790 [Actinobacteria bacterium 13_1_20CM_2_65_11]|nr:MAG: hypothetical protein AUG06_07790 [Actinobacteria bacterium 13_1_20CM_2_65_11]